MLFSKSKDKNEISLKDLDAEVGIDLNVEAGELVDGEKSNQDWLETEGQLSIDVYQTPNNIVIKSAVAGVNQADIDIAVSGDTVTIKGQRQAESNIAEKDYFYQECYWGKFSRSVILPVDVDSERASASLKNGILTVRLPKVNKAKVRRIKIKED